MCDKDGNAYQNWCYAACHECEYYTICKPPQVGYCPSTCLCSISSHHARPVFPIAPIHPFRFDVRALANNTTTVTRNHHASAPVWRTADLTHVSPLPTPSPPG